jgi:hypothetical protein
MYNTLPYLVGASLIAASTASGETCVMTTRCDLAPCTTDTQRITFDMPDDLTPLAIAKGEPPIQITTRVTVGDTQFSAEPLAIADGRTHGFWGAFAGADVLMTIQSDSSARYSTTYNGTTVTLTGHCQ